MNIKLSIAALTLMLEFGLSSNTTSSMDYHYLLTEPAQDSKKQTYCQMNVDNEIDTNSLWLSEQEKVEEFHQIEVDGSVIKDHADFDYDHFLDGSSLERVRSAISKLPVPDYVINDAVRAYQAPASAKFLTLPDGDYINLIYSGDNVLQQREREEIEKFKQWLKDNDKKLPSGFLDDHHWGLRHLNDDNGWNHQETFAQLVELDRWLGHDMLQNIENYEKNLPFLEHGMVYGHMRDKNQRPVVYYDLRKFVDSKIGAEDLVRMLNFFTAYNIYNALVRGQVETITYVLDARGVALYELPIALFSELQKHGLAYFKQCMFSFDVIGAPWLARAAFNFLSPAFDKFSRHKFNFQGSDWQSVLAEKIGKENLEEKYGGSLPNYDYAYFPPRFNP